MSGEALRIIDANLNRAREGLRVLEEYARFIVEDEAATRRLKDTRHALRELAAAFGAEELLAARDTPRDVGTHITNRTEQHRADLRAVATAAMKRVEESLRAIEEYGKLSNTGAAANAEKLRYSLYTLEQELLLGGPRRRRLRAARLHVLVTESLCRGPWLQVCEQALVGGADVLQLREKTLPDGELLRCARQLRELTKTHDALLMINDRPDIARLSGADGVHVGQTDLPIAEVRRIVGPHQLIGISTHGLAEARAALLSQPDYLAVGPMFASSTKPDVPVQGLNLLTMARELTQLPIVAIGGITADRVTQLRQAWSASSAQPGKKPRSGLAHSHPGNQSDSDQPNKESRISLPPELDGESDSIGNEAIPTTFQIAVSQGVIGSGDPAGAVRALRQELSWSE